jgi:hypothetical protein
MEQYYKIVILDDHKKNKKEIIKAWIHPTTYDNGTKLMEHSYFDSTLMNAIEHLISSDGLFHKCRIIWCGDYAQEEPDLNSNLYSMVIEDIENYDKQIYPPSVKTQFKYFVNHSKRLYVDKQKIIDNKNNNSSNELIIHPLPLLVSDKSNGNGAGDYSGNNEYLFGTWARDTISVETYIPKNYKELKCNF